MRLRPFLPLLLLAACQHQPDLATPPASEASPPAEVRFVIAPDSQKPSIRLSDADPGADTSERLPVSGAPLDESAARALLARLPPLPEDEAVEFALRSSSKPAPRPGETVAVAFPPAPAELPPPTFEGPPKVLRHGPEGEVPLAPYLSVTFDQPMIALTTQDEAARDVPVRLSPQSPGQWRWIGTRTALFEPDQRFPMATEYEAIVPAGSLSALGDATLAEFRWTFATPPPALRRVTPTGGPLELLPVFVVEFDQAVDGKSALPSLSLDGPGSPSLRLATAAEVQADERARAALAGAARPEHAFAVVPTAPLPRASTFQLVAHKGLPSAEGPRSTTADERRSLTTFSPLQIEEHRCSWGGKCPPQSAFSIRFNNPLDGDAFDPATLVVEPAIPNLRASVGGNWMTLDGRKQGRTTYTVTVPAGLTDSFGQTLGKDRKLTFDVGPAEPSLQGPAGPLVVLDPAAGRSLSVFATNHGKLRVKAWRVGPEDWNELLDWWEKRWQHEGKQKLPGEYLGERKVDVEGPADTLNEAPIDLAEWLPGGKGHLLLRVEPTRQPPERWGRVELFYWVQATELGATAFADADELIAWANDLQTGEAAAGVQVDLLDRKGHSTHSAITDADGLARLPLPDQQTQALVLRRGDDEVLLPPHQGPWGAWQKTSPSDSLRWYVFDDRGLYKPGETVRAKGWVRRFEAREGGDIARSDVKEVRWTLKGPRWNDLASGTAPVDSWGGFDLQATLPDDVNLGQGHLEISATGDPGGSMHHPVRIQEFRRPEFEVKASHDGGPHLLGEPSFVEVAASYFAGGGLPGAETTWRATSTPGSFTPPGWSEFRFGTWVPWWRHGWMGAPSPEVLVEHGGATDGAGVHRLRVDVDSMPPQPLNLALSATVMDVNRQAWSSTANLLVHPANEYVGLKPDRGFVTQGAKLTVEIVVADLDGAAVIGRDVAVSMAQLDWQRKDGRWQEVELDPMTCPLRSAAEAKSCVFAPREGGAYRVVATITDKAGRPNRSEFRTWVAGAKTRPQRGVEQEQVELVPSGEEFADGDVAEILVNAPFPDAQGLLTLRRSGIVHTERFSIAGSSHTLRIPIIDAYVPDITVQVDLVGQSARADDDGAPIEGAPPRPAYASGSLQLKVPPLRRTLSVQVTPDASQVDPGATVSIDVTITDSDGAPVPDAEAAVVVVDEAILSLTGYRLPDPIGVFYALRGPGASDHHLRALLLLADPDSVGDGAGDADFGGGGGSGDAVLELLGSAGAVRESSGAPMAKRSAGRAEMMADSMDGDMAAMAPPPEPTPTEGAPDGPAIALRARFDALAAFEPAVITDVDGKATVQVQLPDSLTRYRVMVVAVAGARSFGQGESTITARKRLMVRPSPPRFLNFGDRFEFPVVVQNPGESDLVVDVALRSTAVQLTAGSGRRVTVPAGDRVEVRFPAETTHAGRARWQAVATAAGADDAASGELPVWTPATTEAFATYGTIDDGAIRQPVAAPPDVWSQFGGLEITTSSTALQALTDAVIHLVDYPYSCTEQIASRLLALAALRDVLDAFDAEGLPSAPELESQVARDLEVLTARQRPDGGFGLWKRTEPHRWPWPSIHAVHALARLQDKGYAVDAGLRDRGLRYLQQIQRHIPSDYPERSKWTIRAYALSVRALLGDDDPAKAKALLREAGLDGLPMEAQGWLLPLLKRGGHTGDVADLRRHWDNRVTETAGAAAFTTSYVDGAHLLMHTDRRTDGVLLDAILQTDPDADLVVKLVRGLLAHRKKGHWGSTQDNSFVLLALDSYFRVAEGVTPDFVARAWLGDGFAGEHAFAGRTTERARIDVPMSWLTEHGATQDLVLAKEGPGRMYYRLGLKYAPLDLTLEPADRGFVVQRRYEAVDAEADVHRDEDGTWRVRAGARVRTTVTMVAESRRYHVALVDPLPAGFEPINPVLATSAPPPPAPSARPSGRWWWGRWYEHDNLRDERAEAFASLLWEGVWDYTYVSRATTPGTFVVPPPKAEEMYSPETFGRGASAVVVVE